MEAPDYEKLLSNAGLKLQDALDYAKKYEKDFPEITKNIPLCVQMYLASNGLSEADLRRDFVSTDRMKDGARVQTRLIVIRELPPFTYRGCEKCSRKLLGEVGDQAECPKDGMQRIKEYTIKQYLGGDDKGTVTLSFRSDRAPGSRALGKIAMIEGKYVKNYKGEGLIYVDVMKVQEPRPPEITEYDEPPRPEPPKPRPDEGRESPRLTEVLSKVRRFMEIYQRDQGKVPVEDFEMWFRKVFPDVDYRTLNLPLDKVSEDGREYYRMELS